VIHSVAEQPSGSIKLLGGVGVVGGLLLIAAFLPAIPWTPDLFNLRLVAFNAGGIAIAIAMYRRHSVTAPRRALVATVPAVLANAWYMILIIRAVARDGQVGAGDYDPSFNTAGVALWFADAWLGFAILRLGHVWRPAALALGIGSILTLGGASGFLGLMEGEMAWIVGPLALGGIALNGIGWIALGLQLVLGIPVPVPGVRARRWARRAGGGALLLGALAALLGGVGRFATLNGPSATARNQVRAAIEDVAGATGRRYNAVDDRRHEMGGAKIMAAPTLGEFVAVYGDFDDPTAMWEVHLATSSDLLTWTWRVRLAKGGSQPTIRPATDGGYVVAWEQEPPNHLKFAWYPTWDDLLNGTPGKTFEPPMTLSTCAEGTPSLYAASSTALDVGFHFYDNCEVDRQARGTTDWTSWNASPQPILEGMVRAHDVRGGVGDRDGFTFEGHAFTMLEGQAVLGDWTTFRVYLADNEAGLAERLDMRTDAGSTAFTNPTVAQIEFGGRPAIVVSMFVPMEGARGNEVGGLIYYRILGSTAGG